MTLEKYFREALQRDQIDHHLRVAMGADGQPRFYIHPARSSGRTVDFTVQENALTCICTTELPAAERRVREITDRIVDVLGNAITGP